MFKVFMKCINMVGDMKLKFDVIIKYKDVFINKKLILVFFIFIFGGRGYFF